MIEVKIKGRTVKNFGNPFIIPEMSINHNGVVGNAIKIIDKLHTLGAECVKFQCFNTDEFMGKNSLNYTYKTQQGKNTEDMYEMFKRHELNVDDFDKMFDYAKKKGIIAFSTPTDKFYVDYLCKKKVPCFKIGSDDMIHEELIEYMAKKNKPIIFSTGMAELEEIKSTVKLIERYNKKIIILYCVSLYPTPTNEINLNKLKKLQEIFKYPIGFSDHSTGNLASTIAMGMGSAVIEKHFTLDKNMFGPDHKFSCDSNELEELLNYSKNIPKIFGKNKFILSKEEKKMRTLCRRSLYVNKNISKGEVLRKEDLAFFRPGNGIWGNEIKAVLNKKCKVNLKSGTMLKKIFFE